MEEESRRWLVKTDGRVHEVVHESKAVVLSLYPGSQVWLMGTGESVQHASKRVGWES